MNPPSKFGLGSEFDAFLFEPIGEDRNGLPLRIISLLGRQDLDPWMEADTLARLPAEAAAQRLALVLAAVPAPLPGQANPSTLASRLIALLPDQTHPLGPARGTLGTSAPAHPRLPLRAILLATWIVGLLALQAIITRLDPPPTPSATQPPVSILSSSQASPSAPAN